MKILRACPSKADFRSRWLGIREADFCPPPQAAGSQKSASGFSRKKVRISSKRHSPGHSHEIAAQAEMMRRLKNSIEKLDKNTQKYSKILIFLTIILGILAAIQIYLLIKPNQF